jgi:hypothetical protein
MTSVVTVGRGNSAVYDKTSDVVYSPDTRANKAGIVGFRLPATPSPWLSALIALWPFAALLAVFGLFFSFLARSADPARRREAQRSGPDKKESPLTG